ncbi:MAG: hypothetical protein WBE76_12645 [Terracidiphilus sp.]
MLEPLAGRLKSERTSDGIRIVIPSRFDVGPLGDTVLIACIPVLAVDVVAKVDKSWTGWRWEELSLFLLVIAALRLAMIVADKTVLTLNPAWLTIRRGPFGLHWKKSSLATRRLHNLRSVPSTSDWTGKKVRGRETVQFDEDGYSRDVAKQLTSAEAAALIEAMLETYNFADDLEANSVRESPEAN